MRAPRCRVSLVSPVARRRAGSNGVWFGMDISAAAMERLAAAENPEAEGDAVVNEDRGACVVYVGGEGSMPTRVIAWKGLLAMSEVFYAETSRGNWLLTDHFRNMISALPQAQRRMSDEALLQHYTSAAVLRRTTYARGASRLMNGDRLDIDLDTGVARVACFSRHTSIATDEPISRHLERIDGAFEDVMSQLREVEDVAIGFSGGVDSTLLLSYLGDAGTAVTVKPGSPEFDAETEYAREAARLLGRRLDEIQLDESDYLMRLEDIIERQGMPIPTEATPATAVMYALPFSTFIVGEGADAIFGSGRGIRRVAAALSGRAGRSMVRVVEHVPGPIGRRAKQIDGYASLFAEPPRSPHGYAGNTNRFYGGGALARRMFTGHELTALNTRLLEQIYERVDLETGDRDGFLGHMEICLWQYVFADRALAVKHPALGHGKHLATPYLSWRVISEYLKVPARRRYYKGLTGKWIPRSLLAAKVPGYKVNKAKLFTSLPFDRYYTNGPLSGIWDRYDLPEEIPAEIRDEIRSTPSPDAWMAVNHAIWQDRVVANPSLQPHPATIAETFPDDAG